MKALFRLIFASYLHNKLRCVLVMTALVVACAGLSAVLLINASAKASYDSAHQPFLTGVEQRIVPRSGQSINKQDYAQLRRAGFTGLIPILRSQQVVKHATNGSKHRVVLLGIDTFAVLSYLASTASGTNKQSQPSQLSQLWQTPASSIIHPEFAKQLDLSSEQQLILENGQILPKIQVAKINGLGSEIVLDIGQLQKTLGQSTISELLVVGTEQTTKHALTLALPTHLSLENINTAEQAQQLTASFHLNLLAMAGLMFVVCMFVVMNALHLLLMRRWQNLRICRQLGVTHRQIYLVHGVELVLLSVICAPIGTLIGLYLAQLASPLMTQTLQSLFDVRVGFSDTSYYWLLLQSFMACLIGALVAAVLPMQQLSAKLNMLTMPQSTKPSLADSKWLFAGVTLTLMALCGLVIAHHYNSLGASFAGISLFILAGCCLVIFILPLLLKTLFRLIPANWILFRWAIADGVRLSQKSKIACCAFFIAVTSNVGMNLMVDSFRQATQQWLQQRLVADLYVTAEDPGLFNTWLQAQDKNIDLYARQSKEAKLLGQSTTASIELRSYPSNKLYQDALSFAEVNHDAWQLFSAGSGVFINQQLALRYNLALSDPLHFQTEQSPADKKIIVGIYYDFGNQKPQAYLPVTSFAQDPAKATIFALNFDSLQQQQDFIQKLASSTTLKQVNSITSQDLLAVSMHTFERTFVITDGLNIVTLLVAALSLATSVLMIDMDNRPQRALMRSLGLGHYQIAGLSLMQYTLLSALTCLVAIPFGLALSWLLINLINVQAFNWSYPMLISPDKLLKTCALSLSLIGLVVALPLYQLSRRKLIEDIKCIQS